MIYIINKYFNNISVQVTHRSLETIRNEDDFITDFP